MKDLSLLMITKNSDILLEKSLRSVRNLVDEIVIIDGNSQDGTIAIAKKFNARLFQYDEENLGKKRAYGLTKIKTDWVFVLDADEIVSTKLTKEIMKLKISNFQYPISNKIQNSKFKENIPINGFFITYQNHFLGRQVNHGGENYRMLRLFRKDSVGISPAFVHEGFQLKSGKAGVLKNKILHYSYRSLKQMFVKFTDYAVRDTRQKAQRGERSSPKKVLLYAPHMFWARFIKDRGYKDGIFRIPLDIGFAYMELLTYILLWFYSWRRSRPKADRPLDENIIMTDQNSKIAFIVILYKTPKEEVNRLKLEVGSLKFKNYEIYFIDNTKDNRGYAGGVNEGLKKALTDDCELFVVANPDVSLINIKSKNLLDAAAHFDLWGLTMRMSEKTYYGGTIDPLRMSGGLVGIKPRERFTKTEWVSGSLMCITKKVVEKIGYFDERFFMYYEDVDYCFRARKSGLRIGIDSGITYQHFEVSKNNSHKKVWLERSRIRFLLKHGGWKQKLYELARLPKTIYEYIS